MAEEQISSNSEKPAHDIDLVLIKGQLEELKEILKKGKDISVDIEAYYKIFQELRLKLDDPGSGLSAYLNIVERLKNEIEAIKQSSQTNLQEITSLLTSVQTKVDGMNSAYQSFVGIKTQIDDPATGLAITYTHTQTLKGEVEILKTRAEQSLNSIQQTNSDIQAKAQEIAKAYADFQATKATIDDPKEGLEAILSASTALLQKISATQGQSSTLFEEIKKFRDESQGYTKDISALKQRAEIDVKNISEIEAASADLKASIIQSYEVITGTGLANSFDKRKNEIERSVTMWRNWIFASIAILVCILAGIYFTAAYEHILGTTIFWYRLTFASPMVFLIAFATERYAHERNLLEKYAFKSATAFALESYTTLLRNTFGGNGFEEKILAFVLSSMETIYKEPFEHKSESRWSFGIKNKLGEIKAEIAGTKDGVEKIKEMLPLQTKAIVQETTRNVAEEIEKVAPQGV